MLSWEATTQEDGEQQQHGLRQLPADMPACREDQEQQLGKAHCPSLSAVTLLNLEQMPAAWIACLRSPEQPDLNVQPLKAEMPAAG